VCEAFISAHVILGLALVVPLVRGFFFLAADYALVRLFLFFFHRTGLVCLFFF
jgi:hypothetical protein